MAGPMEGVRVVEFGVWVAGSRRRRHPRGLGRRRRQDRTAGWRSRADVRSDARHQPAGSSSQRRDTQRWLQAGGYDALDPFVAMGFAAAHTTTMRLIPNIVVLPYRNPFVVAKAGATLDLVSGGRFTLAVGVGYLKREFAALGVNFDHRAALFEESLQVIIAQR